MVALKSICLLLLFVLLPIKSSQNCSFYYLQQPPTMLDCDPLGINIRLKCLTISSSDNVTWYWTQNVSEAGVSGTAILPGDTSDNYQVSNTFTNNREIGFTVSESTLGYYWCEISNTVNVSLRPSTITPVCLPISSLQQNKCNRSHISNLHHGVTECAEENSTTVISRPPLPTSCVRPPPLTFVVVATTLTPSPSTMTPSPSTMTPSAATMTPSAATMTPSAATMTPSPSTMTPSAATMTPSATTMTPSAATMTPSAATMTPSAPTMTPSAATMTTSAATMTPTVVNTMITVTTTSVVLRPSRSFLIPAVVSAGVLLNGLIIVVVIIIAVVMLWRMNKMNAKKGGKHRSQNRPEMPIPESSIEMEKWNTGKLLRHPPSSQPPINIIPQPSAGSEETGNNLPIYDQPNMSKQQTHKHDLAAEPCTTVGSINPMYNKVGSTASLLPATSNDGGLAYSHPDLTAIPSSHIPAICDPEYDEVTSTPKLNHRNKQLASPVYYDDIVSSVPKPTRQYTPNSISHVTRVPLANVHSLTLKNQPLESETRGEENKSDTKELDVFDDPVYATPPPVSSDTVKKSGEFRFSGHYEDVSYFQNK